MSEPVNTVATADNALPAAVESTTVTEHVSGILDDALKLVRQQLDMLKAEFEEALTRAKWAGVFGGLGIVLLTVGGLTLAGFAVSYLHERFQWPI